MVSGGGGSCPGNPSFDVQVTGNNPDPSSFSLTDGGSQSVTLGAGQFSVAEAPTSGFTTSLSGDCSGTIAAGQQLTCTITNTAVPTTGTLTVNKVCNPDCRTPDGGAQFFFINVHDSAGNVFPLILTGGGTETVTISTGFFTVTEDEPGSFSGDCSDTISAGQHLTCTVTNTGG